MFKDRVKFASFIIIVFFIFAAAVFSIGFKFKNSKMQPCEIFVPDSSYDPGYQCYKDKRTYLKIYDNGNALCVCKENKK